MASVEDADGRPSPVNAHGRHARVRAQTSHHATVLSELVVALGRLEHLGDAGESRVAHDPAKRLGTERAFGDQLVAVAARGERGLRVVEVEAPEALEPDRRVPPSARRPRSPDEVVSRRVEVAGIGAERDPMPHPLADRVAQRRELLERAAERRCRCPRSSRAAPSPHPGTASRHRVYAFGVAAAARPRGRR